MAGTYKEIQQYIKKKYSTTIKTCWIADVKRAHGLTKRKSYNRLSPHSVKYPCPDKHHDKIEDALKHFKSIYLTGDKLVKDKNQLQ